MFTFPNLLTNSILQSGTFLNDYFFIFLEFEIRAKMNVVRINTPITIKAGRSQLGREDSTGGTLTRDDGSCATGGWIVGSILLLVT